MSDQHPKQPMLNLPLAGTTSPSPARHETILPDEPPSTLGELETALAVADAPARRDALLRVAAAHPALLEAWASLSELSLEGGEAVPAYAFARVAYHRGLDRLRREGWGGTGMVSWERPSNRGFLRGLHALLAAAAALDELDESARCRAFLLELDPHDALGVAGYPEVPDAGWALPVIP